MILRQEQEKSVGAMMDDDQGRIPTNLRTLLLLEEIGRSDMPMTAAELGRKIGLPKQTIHRLCNSCLLYTSDAADD